MADPTGVKAICGAHGTAYSFLETKDPLDAIADAIGLSPRYRLRSAQTCVGHGAVVLTLEIQMSNLDLLEISDALSSTCRKSIQDDNGVTSISSIASSLMKGYCSPAAKVDRAA
jgi:hypothetical protein